METARSLKMCSPGDTMPAHCAPEQLRCRFFTLSRDCKTGDSKAAQGSIGTEVERQENQKPDKQHRQSPPRRDGGTPPQQQHRQSHTHQKPHKHPQLLEQQQQQQQPQQQRGESPKGSASASRYFAQSSKGSTSHRTSSKPNDSECLRHEGVDARHSSASIEHE
eukprot:4083980-Pleurochrysis_carterae.AAC.1